MNYFAKIKYLGTDFSGFQVQPNKRTVQGELCSALREALGVPCRVTGCSRTDSGVHANGFCIKIEADGATVPADKLPIAAIRFLPQDISIYYAEECSEDFHPRYDAKSKEYLYLIHNSKIPNPFLFGRVWQLPRLIDDRGIARMISASQYLLGEHDFASFMAAGSDVSSTVRDVEYIKIDKTGDMIEIRISANGFLYNMVRIIVGTLVGVAHGRYEPEDMPKILEAKDRNLAGQTAAAEGLYLNCVNYNLPKMS